jgi:hypothetical protein
VWLTATIHEEYDLPKHVGFPKPSRVRPTGNVVPSAPPGGIRHEQGHFIGICSHAVPCKVEIEPIPRHTSTSVRSVNVSFKRRIDVSHHRLCIARYGCCAIR